MGKRKSHTGRRGRKRRAQEDRERKKHEEREEARRLERELCDQLLKDTIPWVERMCAKSRVGVIIERRIELIGGVYPRDMYFAMYCPDGYVNRWTLGISDLTIHQVHPWEDLTSLHLQNLKKKLWKPFRPKNVLDLLVDATR